MNRWVDQKLLRKLSAEISKTFRIIGNLDALTILITYGDKIHIDRHRGNGLNVDRVNLGDVDAPRSSARKFDLESILGGLDLHFLRLTFTVMPAARLG